MQQLVEPGALPAQLESILQLMPVGALRLERRRLWSRGRGTVIPVLASWEGNVAFQETPQAVAMRRDGRLGERPLQSLERGGLRLLGSGRDFSAAGLQRWRRQLPRVLCQLGDLLLAVRSCDQQDQRLVERHGLIGREGRVQSIEDLGQLFLWLSPAPRRRAQSL